jgi:uncharacterized membrane protein/uncharacterized membrane protein YeaQ/YmgE (transglycosylase-associated protein family)
MLAGVVVAGGVAAGLLRGGLLGLTHGVGYAVCHQITVRTYIFGDWVMPLCARCTGQYLGAMTGFVMAAVWGRLRASEMPPPGILFTLILFLAVWAFDGINSYIFLLTGTPFLYPPHNILRLFTGLLQGLAVSMLFLPFFNRVFWREPDPRPVLRRWRDVGLLLLITAGLALAVHSRWLPLFWPLALLSTLGVLLLLSLIGALLLVMLMRAENRAETWRDLLAFLLPGLAFAVLLIAGIDTLRAWLESFVKLPPPTG